MNPRSAWACDENIVGGPLSSRQTRNNALSAPGLMPGVVCSYGTSPLPHHSRLQNRLSKSFAHTADVQPVSSQKRTFVIRVRWKIFSTDISKHLLEIKSVAVPTSRRNYAAAPDTEVGERCYFLDKRNSRPPKPVSMSTRGMDVAEQGGGALAPAPWGRV
jgi:hypothetical protein